MPERNKTKDVLIGVMTTAMIVVIVLVAYQNRYGNGVETKTMSPQTTPLQTVKLVEPKSIMGKIVSITGATIVVQTTEVGSTQTISRQVLTNTATVFERVIPKDEKIYQSEMNVFNAKTKTTQVSSTSSSGEIPVPFTLQEISLADLRPGDAVAVTSAEDILTANQFMATGITIIPVSFDGATATTSSQ